MLMIGVMPLPALMNSIFDGSGSGSVKTPSISPSRTISPGRIFSHQVRRHHAAVDLLGRHADQAVLRPGSEVSEYARQWNTPSMTTPRRTY